MLHLSIRVVLLCVLVLTASGCSIKLMYNNADRLARWAANDYIRMDDQQEVYFDAEVRAVHYWHRTSELPLYADYLDSVSSNMKDGVSEEEVQDFFDTLFAWWEVFELKITPMMTEMLLSLSDEQVAGLPARLDEDNDEFSEDEADRSVEEIQTEWMKDYSDTMSRFSGRLSREQKDYLTAQSDRYMPQFGLWADYRQRWQGDLLKILIEKRGEPERFAEAFQVLLDSRESYYGDELSGVFAANEALVREMTAWLLSNLTDKQQERFTTRIGEMADTLRELAADVPAEVPHGGGCLVRC